MKFSDKLKKLRKDNNLSQERLSDLLEYQDKLCQNGSQGHRILIWKK